MARNEGLAQVKNRLQITHTDAAVGQKVHNSQAIWVGQGFEKASELWHITLHIYG